MYTEEEVNNILNLRGHDGKLIDVFNLYGLIYVGNTQLNERHRQEWDLTKTFTKFSEHSLGMSIEDFEDCKTEDEVTDTFWSNLRDLVRDRLL